MSENFCVRCGGRLDAADGLRILTRACGPCLNLLFQESPDPGFLETISAPAALVDGSYTVLAANSRFQGVTLSAEGAGTRVGEALDCLYVPTLGRCGESVACILCRLKRSVDHTRATGEGLRGVHMSYPHREEVRRAYSVSTEKIGGAVLVILDALPQPER